MNVFFNLEGATCEDLINIQGLLVALASIGALVAFISSIASCASYCSLRNQEVC